MTGPASSRCSSVVREAVGEGMATISRVVARCDDYRTSARMRRVANRHALSQARHRTVRSGMAVFRLSPLGRLSDLNQQMSHLDHLSEAQAIMLPRRPRL